MTDHTPLYLLGLMFINPGASFFWMALKAGLVFCDEACLSQAGPFSSPMRGMAVRALQGSLEHFVRVRQIEFRFHLLVAGETEVRLLGFEKMLPHRGPMDLVTVIAGNRA